MLFGGLVVALLRATVRLQLLDTGFQLTGAGGEDFGLLARLELGLPGPVLLPLGQGLGLLPGLLLGRLLLAELVLELLDGPFRLLALRLGLLALGQGLGAEGLGLLLGLAGGVALLEGLLLGGPAGRLGPGPLLLGLLPLGLGLGAAEFGQPPQVLGLLSGLQLRLLPCLQLGLEGLDLDGQFLDL